MSESERIEWRAVLADAFAVSGMSERAVSEQCKINRGSLSDVLASRSVPRTATVEALRKVFDLPADIDKARLDVARRRERPGATPTIYWIPEAGSEEADEPVRWGHMEARFSEMDARIARIELAVIKLSDLADRYDPNPEAQYRYAAKLRQAAEERAKKLRPSTGASGAEELDEARHVAAESGESDKTRSQQDRRRASRD